MTGTDDASWSTQQLTELLSLVSALPDGANVAQRAVEHAAEALEAEVGALISDGRVLACVGYAADAVPVDDLIRAAARGGHLDVPGVGPCEVFNAACDSLPGGVLLLARSLQTAPSAQDRSLLRALARVLSLALQARTVVDDERRRRADSEEERLRGEALVISLQERQALLERLSRVQRSISARRPLHEVLETIVVGAAELIGDECAALRLLSDDDPGYMTIAASTGIAADLLAATRRSSVHQGIGGRAVTEGQLVATDDYASSDTPLTAYVGSGLRCAMAAPVRQGDVITGSLVVSSWRPGRTYSNGEKEVLLAFAEHASLALNDARTVEALRSTVARATHEAQHDGLTGLPNRTRFLEMLQKALGTGSDVGVLFLDLDDFKIVNDTLGHPVGDQLLCEVAGRVRSALRSSDTVARLGGDEFAVLLSDATSEATIATSERIHSAMSRPFRLPGHQLSVRASTGVVVWPAGSVASAEDLLRDADVAMYRAKGAGKGGSVLFEPEMRLDLQARSQIEQDLRLALDSDELEVFYQPVVDVVAGRAVGAEALLRWHHPVHGSVSPATFIPVAEETGMILALGRRVLLEACRAALSWPIPAGGEPMRVSVNVSARQLAEPTFYDDVRRILNHTGLPPTWLTLELTETVLVRDVDGAAATLRALNDLGVGIAIDDFGTAYSSLSYLAALPVNALKIDKSFVRGSATRIAAGIVALADGLGLDTVVEGVETVEELTAMTDLGCRIFQGYLWSPAVPGAELPAVADRIARHFQGPVAPVLPLARSTVLRGTRAAAAR